MPDHRFMPSSEVHEPKHISTATTADAGKVLTPDFSTDGVSVLRALTPEEVGVTYAYAEMGKDENTASFSLTAASDSSLYTDIDYTNITSTELSGVTMSNNTGNMTFDGSNNTLIPSVSGTYRLFAWFNVNSDTANSLIGIRRTVDGIVEGPVTKADIKEIGRTENVVGFGIVNVTAGQEYGIAIACDKSADITIEDFRLSLQLIRPA